MQNRVTCVAAKLKLTQPVAWLLLGWWRRGANEFLDSSRSSSIETLIDVMSKLPGSRPLSVRHTRPEHHLLRFRPFHAGRRSLHRAAAARVRRVRDLNLAPAKLRASASAIPKPRCGLGIPHQFEKLRATADARRGAVHRGQLGEAAGNAKSTLRTPDQSVWTAEC